MKKAILIICFGNNNINNQLENFKRKLKENFNDYKIYICFTSVFFIKKYGYSIEEVLNNIYIKKYNELICIPLFTVCGNEYEKAIFYIYNYKEKFKNIKLANPLLYNEEDFLQIYNFIKKYYKENTLYICHGVDNKSNDKYKKLFNMFEKENIFFSNLESSPTIHTTIKNIKEKNINSICIKPFLLFKGKHIEKDISYNIKNILLENNIFVKLDLKPLIQYNEIINIFIKHLIESKEI